MQIDCPNCRRVLDFAGERPSFSAPIAASLLPRAKVHGSSDRCSGASTLPPRTRSGTGLAPVVLEETVDYQARKASTGGSAVESFPEQIAGYRLIRKLGSGGMGTVFEAEDEAHSRRVAIKLISSEALASEEALERFRQEGRLANAVTHPRCVFVLAVDEHQGHPYIVMELMPGTTLQNLVEKQGPLEPADAIARIMDVVEGLRQFHKLGLIHRDVKPSNCFLEKEGEGEDRRFRPLEVARRRPGPDPDRHVHRHASLRVSGADQAGRGGRADRRLFGVGDALLSPHRASAGAGQGRGRSPRGSPRSRRRHSGAFAPRSPPLEAVVHRGLERDPGRRWRNLQELRDALLPFVPGLSMAGIGRRVGAFVMDIGLGVLRDLGHHRPGDAAPSHTVDGSFSVLRGVRQLHRLGGKNTLDRLLRPPGGGCRRIPSASGWRACA